MKEYSKTTGFVLDNSTVKENSAVITILTPDIGIISITMHGYNSKKNIFRSVLQPANLVEMHLEKHNDKYKLIDCSAADTYEGIKKDYKKTVAVLSVFSTLINSEIYDHKDYNLIFTLIRKFLESVNEKQPCLLTTSIFFYYQLVWCLGVSFTFHDDKPSEFRYLDVENGTFYCRGTSLENEKHIRVSDILFRVMKKFIDIRFADIDKLDYISVNEYNEFRNMYKRYTAYHFNKAILILPAIISEAVPC